MGDDARPSPGLAAPPSALKVVLAVAAVVVPFLVAYTAFSYRVFRGKARAGLIVDLSVLLTSVSLADFELDWLILVKRAKTARLDLRMVNEHILRAAIRSDKAEALIAVEPLYGSLCHLLLSLSTMDAIRYIHD